jgi:hypothetical protein
MSSRDNRIFEDLIAAYNGTMTETRIFLGVGQAAALLWHHDHDRRSVAKCATCNGRREAVAVDRSAWFCGDCLDRSRSHADLGGES